MKGYLLPLMLIFLLMFAGCSHDPDQYNITIASGEEYVEECPESAKAGERVTFQVLFVTDADMHISINGSEDYGSFTEGERYQFIMPEEDVRIDVWVVSNGLAETEQNNKNTKGLETKASGGGRWPPSGSRDSEKSTTGKGSLPKDSPKPTEKTEAATAKKKGSASATTAVDPFDHDIEAYYEDNKDIYDSFDDAWDGFEDDEDAWDDY